MPFPALCHPANVVHYALLYAHMYIYIYVCVYFKYSHILDVDWRLQSDVAMPVLFFFPVFFFFLSRFMKEKLKKRIIVVGTNQSEVGPRSALSAACSRPAFPQPSSRSVRGGVLSRNGPNQIGSQTSAPCSYFPLFPHPFPLPLFLAGAFFWGGWSFMHSPHLSTTHPNRA